MKKNLPTILSGVACLLLVWVLSEISQTQSQLQYVQGEIQNISSEVQRTTNNLVNRMQSVLEQEASLLSDSSWTYGEANYETLTVPVAFSVTPKEYTTATTAILVCNGVDYPLTMQGGVFTTTIDIPVFGKNTDYGESVVTQVRFQEGDTTRTESLNWYFTPRTECLPEIYVNWAGGSQWGVSSTNEEEGVPVSIRGSLNVDAYGRNVNSISATLIQEMDGKDV